MSAENGKTSSDKSGREELVGLIMDINPKEIANHIERDNLKEWCISIQVSMQLALMKIKEEKELTADVRENKRGEWVMKNVRGEAMPCCSVCGLDNGTLYEFDFCPTCGADMRGEKDE